MKNIFKITNIFKDKEDIAFMRKRTRLNSYKRKNMVAGNLKAQ